MSVSTSIGAGAARGGDAGEHTFIFTTDQAGYSEASNALHTAAVGSPVAVGRDGSRRLVDDQFTGFKGQLVVVSSAAGGMSVSTSIGAGAARGGDAGEHTFIFTTDQAGYSEASNALHTAVVGSLVAIGNHSGNGFVDIRRVGGRGVEAVITGV